MPDLRTLPLDALTRSPLNPRQIIDPDSLSDLADSIRAVGLIQNLCGLETPKGVQIVAGGRRLAALRLLADLGHPVPPVPVLVTDDLDQATEWAGAENAARADLHPADEVAHYAAMLARGMAPTAIAAAFGVSERHVAQRLKLAGLPDAALAALRANKITLDQATALTLVRADSEASANLLAMAQQGHDGARLRQVALNDTVRADRDRRALLVGQAAYHAAGGAVTHDLFSAAAVIEDVALLDRLFTERVETERAALIQAGWGWVVVLDDSYFPYGLGGRIKEATVPAGKLTRAQRGLCGGWLLVDREGRVQTRLGWVSASDEAAARQAGLLPPLATPPSAAEAPGDEPDDSTTFSAALLADLRAIRHHALVAALIAQADYGNAVLCWAMTHPHRARIMDATIKDGPLAPEVAEGFTPGDLDEAHHVTAPSYGGVNVAESAITIPLLRSLRYGFSWTANDPDLMAVYRQAEVKTAAWMRAHWVPTRGNFFGRVPSGYLDQVYNQILGFVQSDDAAREFARLKKSEKAQVLHALFNDPATARGYRHMTTAAAQRIRDWAPVFD